MTAERQPLTKVDSGDSSGTGSTLAVSRADSLATGLAFMFGLTVVQRMIGFGRSILFCGLLEDDQLGRWSLAFSFLLLAAPLCVLGLPGSFGRYVEYYRQREQLGTFLRRTVTLSLVLASLAVGLILLLAPTGAWLVFGDRQLAPLVRLLTLTLVAVIGFNFATELLTALRQVRVVSLMQFANSFLFALSAFVLLKFTELGERAVVIAFGLSSLTATLIVIGPLWRIGRDSLACRAELAQVTLWKKLLPFAAWVWVADLMANLFDAVDRFMIVHFAQSAATEAESLVGQYHASRVVPFLLVAVAGMVAGVILPYLSHDWESDRKETVSRRQTMTLKLGGLALTGCGAMILLGSPILFTWILRGKYDQGLHVLPWTMLYCSWFSLMILSQNYLWCAEKARLGSFALMLGLGVNVGMNVVLLPLLGLQGAVMATCSANAVTLATVLFLSSRNGLRVDAGTVTCCLLPLLLVVGPLLALAALAVVGLEAVQRQWLFDEEQRNWIRGAFDRVQSRLWTNSAAESSIPSIESQR